ncbi:hypothetical protein [Streptomyces sp. NPDC002790]|uniref:hypothetical protein n=1 Tax=Streptomyces sp. NPDC002790 TaxID=3154431 RepID=UPI0033321C81
MTDIESRATATRRRRASTGLTALAVALLVCGAAVEATGHLLDTPGNGSGNGSGSGPRPATTAQPSHTRSRAAEPTHTPPHSPPPDRRLPTAPSLPPSPTPTAASGPWNGR